MIYDILEEKADSLTDLISDEGVCRTAPATPGLLVIHRNKEPVFGMNVYPYKRFTQIN